MAVAAVSRDTMRSFSPPAATPVTVSVTATLLLAELQAGRTLARRVSGGVALVVAAAGAWGAGGRRRVLVGG